MPTEIQEPLSAEDRYRLLKFLNQYGKKKWRKIWKLHLAIPANLDIGNIEDVLRYLLFRALINQQADTKKVRKLIKTLFNKFKEELLYKPWEIDFNKLMREFKKVGGKKGSKIYRVGFLGGLKPISLFLYRYAAFSLFIKEITNKGISFRSFIEKKANIISLYNQLRSDPILNAGWVGNDPKACRMLVDWIAYLYNEVWMEKSNFSLRDTLMIVDGHVGKVFARTGLLREIPYESRRPYIIQASKMRLMIEKLVSSYKDLIPFYVDNGAFYIYEDGYCLEKEAKCSICPIKDICKKYIKWTGYRQIKSS